MPIMNHTFNKEGIHSFLQRLSARYPAEIVERGAAYDATYRRGGKSIVLTWPFELGEVFVCFEEGGSAIYEDWFECLESDDLPEFMEYVISIVVRYLESNTRLQEKGWWLWRRHTLEYLDGNSWRYILAP